MPIPIYKKAEECLGESTFFERLQGGLPNDLATIVKLEGSEECIGLYHNGTGMDELILITNLGLHLITNDLNSEFVAYRVIDAINWLVDDKMKIVAFPQNKMLVLRLKDGRTCNCPVRGGADLFVFNTFLYRAIELSN